MMFLAFNFRPTGDAAHGRDIVMCLLAAERSHRHIWARDTDGEIALGMVTESGSIGPICAKCGYSLPIEGEWPEEIPDCRPVRISVW
jgi:hypothetical protein